MCLLVCQYANLCLHFSHANYNSAAGPVDREAAEGSSRGAAGFSTDRGAEESGSELPLGSDVASACITHPHTG